MNNATTIINYSEFQIWSATVQQLWIVFITYVAPFGIILAYLNNLICIIIFIKCKDVYEKISPSFRFYYIIIAISDIAAVFPNQLSDWLGMQDKLFSQLHVFKIYQVTLSIYKDPFSQ